MSPMISTLEELSKLLTDFYANSDSNLVSDIQKPNAETIAELSNAFYTLGETAPDKVVALCRGQTPENVQKILFQRNASKVTAKLIQGRSTVALYLHEHAPFYNQQQLQILKALSHDARYNVVTLLSVSPYPIKDYPVDQAWYAGNTLYIPNTDEIKNLGWIDVFLALDYCASRPIALPPKAKRIVQPHGTDIKFQYSVEFYGAGLMFDYVLAPSFAPENLCEDFRTRYDNIFPRCLIDHESRELRLIPFGSPKLDEFIAIAKDKVKTDIIYNVSMWGLETVFVHENLAHNIQVILDTFPDRRLVFRCFPGEENLLEDIIRPFRSHPRFFVSNAPSYVQDYSAGAVLIYHRGSSAEVFALSTGSPIVRFDGHNTSGQGIIKTNLGYVVHTHDQFLQALRGILQDRDHRKSEIFAYRDSIIPHAGRALAYLMDCIEHIVKDEPQPEWKRILLYGLSESKELDKSKVLRSAQQCHQRGLVIPMLAAKSADTFPEEPLLNFLACKSIFEHIYPIERVHEPWLIALEYFARYLKTKTSDKAVEQTFYTAEAASWLRTVFPERFIGLISHAFKYFNAQEMENLRQLLAQLPVDALDPTGIPQILRDFRESVLNNPSLRPSAPLVTIKELSDLKIQLSIELLNQAKYDQAIPILLEAQQTDPHNVGIFFLLAHALKGQGQYAEAVRILDYLDTTQRGLFDVKSLLDETKALMAQPV